MTGPGGGPAGLRDARSDAPPWGPLGVLAGIGATVSVVLLGIVVVVLALGDDPADAAVRYSGLLVQSLALIGVPVAVSIGMGGSLRALGFANASPRAIAEGVVAGAVLVAVYGAWFLLLEAVAPALYRQHLAELESQRSVLEGPLALFLPLAVLMAPLSEEVFFRGFVFRGLRARLGFPLASGLSAMLFALVHAMPVSTPPLFAIGLVAAVLVERHRSLYGALALHVTYNAVIVAIGLATTLAGGGSTP